MNRDDIIRMAQEAGATNVDAADPQCWAGDIAFEEEELERFFLLAAAAGAAAEREACAKVCDDEALRCEAAVQRAEPDEVSAIRLTAWKISVCAAAIRARGEK
jgi:hypothetical protein